MSRESSNVNLASCFATVRLHIAYRDYNLHHSRVEDWFLVKASDGDDMLVLVVASGFTGRLLSKPKIEGFLERRHPELSTNFRSIVQATSLDQSMST